MSEAGANVSRREQSINNNASYGQKKETTPYMGEKRGRAPEATPYVSRKEGGLETVPHIGR